MAADAASSPPATAASWLDRVRPRSLVFHVLLLSALIVALAPFLHLQTGWVGDEGAYALQVRSLQQGGWEYDYGAQVIDPKGSWFPLPTGEGFDYQFGGRFYSYAKHPTYSMLQRISVGVLGDALGFHAMSMLGAVLCAVAAWLLADEVAGRARALSFWVAASGPVFFNAFVQWAHALSAGLAGLTLVCALRVLRPRFDGAVVAAVFAGCLFGGLIRAESVLFGVAIAVGLGLVGLRRIGFVRAGLGSSAALLGAVCAYLGGARLVELVVGGSYATGGVREGGKAELPYLAGRLAGAYHVLVQGSEITPRANRLLQWAAVLVVVGAIAFLLARRTAALAGGMALLAALALTVLRFQENPLESATGLLVAWPVLLAGSAGFCVAVIASRRRPTDARAMQWTLPAMVLAAFSGAVFLTQYPVGGGLEWGARFLSPATAPLAVFVALGLVEIARRQPVPWARGLAVMLTAAVAVAPIAGGIRMLERYRSEKQAFYDELQSRSGPVLVVGVLPLVEIARGAWKMDDRFDFVLAPSGDATLAVSMLRSAGFRDISLLDERADLVGQDLSYPLVEDVTGPHAANAGWSLLRLREAPLG